MREKKSSNKRERKSSKQNFTARGELEKKKAMQERSPLNKRRGKKGGR